MRALPIVAALFAASLAAACGGGGGSNGGDGNRVTDPAKVATATQLSDNVTTYQIKDGVVSSPQGATTVTPGQGATGGTTAKTHVVVSGDTCNGIATQYGISFDELIKANRFIDPGCTNLGVGESLKIPGAAGTTGASATPTRTGGAGTTSAKTHVVVSGDTCGAIAAQFGVDVGALISLNGLSANCTDLDVGQTLKIP